MVSLALRSEILSKAFSFRLSALPAFSAEALTLILLYMVKGYLIFGRAQTPQPRAGPKLHATRRTSRSSRKVAEVNMRRCSGSFSLASSPAYRVAQFQCRASGKVPVGSAAKACLHALLASSRLPRSINANPVHHHLTAASCSSARAAIASPGLPSSTAAMPGMAAFAGRSVEVTERTGEKSKPRFPNFASTENSRSFGTLREPKPHSFQRSLPPALTAPGGNRDATGSPGDWRQGQIELHAGQVRISTPGSEAVVTGVLTADGVLTGATVTFTEGSGLGEDLGGFGPEGGLTISGGFRDLLREFNSNLGSRACSVGNGGETASWIGECKMTESSKSSG